MLKKMIDMAYRVAPLGVIVVVAIIAWLSLAPAISIPGQDHSDKINHFIAYLVLSAGTVFALRGRFLGLAALTLIVYGLVLEAGQMVLPFGRDSSWLDALANALGVGIGLVAGGACHIIASWLRQT